MNDRTRTDIQAIVAVASPDKFRFLSADTHRAYTAILWILLEHHRAHEIEVYYDDLMIEALAVVPSVESGTYTPEMFRSDVKQLEDWGNLAPRRLEPRRIETLADRSLQKFLCRLDDETVAILEFLHGRSQAAVTLSDRGRHLLRDASERANEALRLAQKIVRERAVTSLPPDPETAVRMNDVLRLSHLCLEIDRKVDDAARELAAFDAELIGFALSPFRLEALSDVIERLERYVEDYVAEASTTARVLHQTARRLLRPSLDAVFADSREQVQLRMRNDPFFAGSPGVVREAQQIIRELVPFFAPGGRFGTLLERVHRSARDVVRRVHKHIENVRARNIRIETLRDRSRDMAHLADHSVSVANAWINELFASAHLVSDLRLGTPAERSALPRPVRRYDARRAMYRGQFLVDKQGTPGQSKALERLRLFQLDRFVDRKIFQGSQGASLDMAALSEIQDFRSLLEAIKVHELRAGRARKLLSYTIVRPESNESSKSRARFVLPEGCLDTPNLIFTRTRGPS